MRTFESLARPYIAPSMHWVGETKAKRKTGSCLFEVLTQTIPAPPKDAPVVPVILRTRYVGSFDMMLDEFEKIEVSNFRVSFLSAGAD